MFECKKCGKKCFSFLSLANHIHSKHIITSKMYYDEYLKKENEGICLQCGESTIFGSIKKGYRKFCSRKCMSNSKEIREKTKKTNLERTGFENPSQVEEYKNQKVKTCLKNSGYKYSFENPDVSIKFKINHWTKCKSRLEKFLKTKLKLFFCTRIKNFMKQNSLNFLDCKYKGCYHKHKWKCLNCNLDFTQTWNSLQQGYKCPNCFSRRKSKQEKELLQFVKSLTSDLIFENSKSVLENKKNHRKDLEIDIYISNLKLAFEFNGLYWHSEKNGKSSEYHLIKTLKCFDLGIRLIHIFEDEWNVNKKSMKALLEKIVKEDWDLLPNHDFESICLNRRFCKSPKYYKKLDFKVEILNPRLYANKDKFKVWDCGFLILTKNFDD